MKKLEDILDEEIDNEIAERVVAINELPSKVGPHPLKNEVRRLKLRKDYNDHRALRRIVKP